MLNNNTRAIYLDELRPPEQYNLDWAIGTTFSLDLTSLLIVPMSMSLYDYSGEEAMPNNPIALLDAIRKMSDRFIVFCQSGRISVPKKDTRIFNYLEKSVIEVNLQNENASFHPKTWLLRFTNRDPGKDVFYRFLCLSRNLTFDRSWDTILTLEGKLNKGRTLAYSRNHPLADFVQALQGLVPDRLTSEQVRHIREISDEVRRVEFKPPPGFDDEISFVPMGIPRYQTKRMLDPKSRMMIVSPFLSEEVLARLPTGGERNCIISRLDSFESLSNEAINRLQQNTDLYYLDNAAEITDPDNIEESEFGSIRDNPKGLHAKLYISEKGWDAHIHTGSANATNAAYFGDNVEFLVALKGRKSKVGIDVFLGNEGSKGTFRDLLCPYNRESNGQTEDAIHTQLDNMLELARRKIAQSDLFIDVESQKEGLYRTIIKSKNATPLLPEGVFVECYPISIDKSNAKDVSSLYTSGRIIFDDLALVSITGFIAFSLRAEFKGQKMSATFVRNLPLEGLPEERDSSVLIGIINDSRKFIQYILMILSGDPSRILDVAGVNTPGTRSVEGAGIWGMEDIPLFEELLRASRRQPEKLQQINRLIQEIKKANPDTAILPEGFESVWAALLEPRK